MSSIKSFLATTAVVLTLPLAACSQETTATDALPKEQIETIVRDYILNNPKIVIEAINKYQSIRQAEANAKKRDVLTSMSSSLKNNPNDPVIGNPDGDLTVVEFFDYRCGYCKKVFPDVQKLIKSDGNIRYVMKEFPILGPQSVYASRAAQAVWLHQSDKYHAFHTAMMLNRGGLGKGKVMDLAKNSGVDIDALKDQMDDPIIQKTFDATVEQAKALGISGTPAFIFGNDIAPGAISLASMIDMTVAARKKANKKDSN
ncbi:MAG: thioredoxin domain-containing protein [Magnetovibrio sp.]|nr:thioredoxin domain-containing protein [Magnetovibrio sp.]